MAKFTTRDECAKVIKEAKEAFRLERDARKRKAVTQLQELAKELLGMTDEEINR